MNNENIKSLISAQREFFKSNKTKDISFRLEMLNKLKRAVIKYQDDIIKALYDDMKKPATEAYIAEVYIVLNEIDILLKDTSQWAKPRRVKTSPVLFSAKSFIYPEPYGVALIISPWNYPFQLLIDPLAGAIAAGNCSVLKPSELAPATSVLIAKMIKEEFDPRFIAVVEGGIESSTALLAEKFDYIFYTGSTSVGRVVMRAAAENLTPLTLELGGKSPVIIDEDANLEIAARRIVKGKFFNAGQTCIAPDYLYVHSSIIDNLNSILKEKISEFYGEDPYVSSAYARIINDRHFSRLSKLISGNIIYGGKTVPAGRYISPTIINNATWNDPVMQEEIFGPILPVMPFTDLESVISEINSRPKPLALYYFSNNSAKQEKILRETSSGGVCINDTMEHIISEYLPFGGVGESGMGAYHGRASFDAFSHAKSVLKKSFRFDVKLKYAPYRVSLSALKKILKILS
jgi:aldehyde dehydrogenase (NAD+)